MMNFGIVDKIRLTTLDRIINWILEGVQFLYVENLEMVASIPCCPWGSCLVKNFQERQDWQYIFHVELQCP